MLRRKPSSGSYAATFSRREKETLQSARHRNRELRASDGAGWWLRRREARIDRASSPISRTKSAGKLGLEQMGRNLRTHRRRRGENPIQGLTMALERVDKRHAATLRALARMALGGLNGHQWRPTSVRAAGAGWLIASGGYITRSVMSMSIGVERSRRSDTVLEGPGELLFARHAAAGFPAVIGIAAAATMILARIRLRRLRRFGHVRRRRGKRDPEGQQRLHRHETAGHEPPGSAAPPSIVMPSDEHRASAESEADRTNREPRPFTSHPSTTRGEDETSRMRGRSYARGTIAATTPPKT